MVVCNALSEHYEYLADENRLRAYESALSTTIKPGDAVLDLGSGTGILGLLACRTGARRVYSVEMGSIIGLARQICRANGFHDRVTFLRGLSTELELPEKVDVVVADQIGNLGLNSGLLEFFRDARQRFLKPDGLVIPSSVDLLAAPVECPEIFEDVEFWCQPKSGFNLSPIRTIAANTAHFANLRAHQILGAPATLTSLKLSESSATRGALNASASFIAHRDGTLHGIGTWFSAQLSSNVTLTNSPLCAEASRRRHLFLPIGQPVPVLKGDQVNLSVRGLGRQSMISWRVEVPGKACFSHSTWNGMLLSEEDLRQSRPDFVPTLTPLGKARLLALNLCDGQRPLGEIEEEVFRSCRAMFHSLEDASAFVAEVVARYSR